MAKLKADWLKEAKELGLDVTAKNTVAEIKSAIEPAGGQAPASSKKPKSTEDKKQDTEGEPLAKSGKRSKRGLEEAETKAKKEARKRGEMDEEHEGSPDESAEEKTKKGPVPVTRPKVERQSKRFRKAAEQIDKTKEYDLPEAVKLAVSTSKVNFDPTLELHVRLSADPKQADQNIRETVNLPHGTGKVIKVAVFADDAGQKKAKEAGADIAGEEEILELLDKEQFDFDVLIATPKLMSQLGKYAKKLGPKGLMPNPKSGTVSSNVAKAVKQAKGGRVEFRIDKQGIVHVPSGKMSFGADKLEDNLKSIISALRASKPASIKSQYVLSAYLTTSMGPSIKLSASDLLSDETTK